MGDRSNIYFPEQYGGDDRLSRGIYLYGHWAGPSLFKWAQQALDSKAARNRWDDGSYLTRIIVHRILTDHADSYEPTGWGLGASIGDNEYPILVIDAATQRVYLVPEGHETQNDPNNVPIGAWTFEQFVGLDPRDLTKLAVAA